MENAHMYGMCMRDEILINLKKNIISLAKNYIEPLSISMIQECDHFSYDQFVN